MKEYIKLPSNWLISKLQKDFLGAGGTTSGQSYNIESRYLNKKYLAPT
jgi:hypothetical protein